jgi:hypothetical protein
MMPSESIVFAGAGRFKGEETRDQSPKAYSPPPPTTFDKSREKKKSRRSVEEAWKA